MNIIGGLLMLLVLWAGFIGYVMNIITMFHATEFSALLLLRITGLVIFPLGSVVGFF